VRLPVEPFPFATHVPQHVRAFAKSIEIETSDNAIAVLYDLEAGKFVQPATGHPAYCRMARFYADFTRGSAFKDGPRSEVDALFLKLPDIGDVHRWHIGPVVTER
jgi:hypothetical protein